MKSIDRFEHLRAASDRRRTNSMKWDSGPAVLSREQLAADPLPMWVADMDFQAPDCVVAALHEAVDFGVFGYSAGPTAGYLDATVDWQRRRFGWEVSHEWVVPTSGIITTQKAAVQAFTRPGDSVLIQPPVYSHFHHDVLINGRHLALAPLRRVEDGYEFDEGAFERAIRPDTKIFILSHPHNPTGNVWTEAELRTMGEICAHHGVLVVSDEIHQDLIMDETARHVPFATLGASFARNSITCISPSKTFNIAGLQCANAIIPDPTLRDDFARQYERNLFPHVNSLGMIAAEAAYRHGEPWLEELVGHVRANHHHFAQRVNSATSKVSVLPAQSLYLAWMDCRETGLTAEELEDFFLLEARVWFDKGQKFGVEGRGYMRANLGCPRSTVDEAIMRLLAALDKLPDKRDGASRAPTA